MFITLYTATQFPRHSIFVSIRRLITKIPKDRNLPWFKVLVHIPTSVALYFFFGFKTQAQ